jgi:hypothetical protein
VHNLFPAYPITGAVFVKRLFNKRLQVLVRPASSTWRGVCSSKYLPKGVLRLGCLVFSTLGIILSFVANPSDRLSVLCGSRLADAALVLALLPDDGGGGTEKLPVKYPRKFPNGKNAATCACA